MRPSDHRDLLDALAASGGLVPFPLAAPEARALVDGDPDLLRGCQALARVRLPTPAGLGRRALLPGGFAYNSEVVDGMVDVRLDGPDGEVGACRIRIGGAVDGGEVIAAVVDPSRATAGAAGLLFAALASAAHDARLASVRVLVRLDRPDALAALGHAFGTEIEALVAPETWSFGLEAR